MKTNEIEKRNLGHEFAWVVKRAMFRDRECFGNMTIAQVEALSNIIEEELPALLDSWESENNTLDKILDY
jgi:hypothetical protein